MPTRAEYVAQSLAWWQAEEARLQAAAEAGSTALMTFTHQGQTFDYGGYVELVRKMIEFYSGPAGQQIAGPFTLTSSVRG